MEIPPDLREALDSALSGVGVREAADTVERLIGAYRSGRPATAPILSTVDDVRAYAGYRMPATFSAARAALAHLAAAAPGFAPTSQLDLGGGTGAAAWAAVEQFPSLADVRVVDQVAAALELGRTLAAKSPLYRASWTVARLLDVDLPTSDLVTISYVLGELSADDQALLVERAIAGAGALVVVEPGTPAGYNRMLAARAQLIAAGFTVVAPCPHQAACPMIPGQDWCHFSVRVNRSSVHRRLKGGELGYEDEKFAYVAAVRGFAQPQPGRVLRRPHLGKGLVSLYVCTAENGLIRETVSKRQGERYRAARDLAWGDLWAVQ